MNRAQLKSVLVGFYSKDELSAARAALLDEANKLDTDGLPRCPKHKGDNRVKLIVDELIDLATVLDEHELIDQLPTYVMLQRILIVCIL